MARAEGFSNKLAVPWFLLTRGFQYFASLTITLVELLFYLLFTHGKEKQGFL